MKNRHRPARQNNGNHKPAKAQPDRQTLDAAQLNAVAELFSVLSETSRLQILQALATAPLNVGEMVQTTGLKQANVSKQLGILLAAGIIARRADGNRAIYTIAMPMVFDLCRVVCSAAAEHAANRAHMLLG